VMTMRLDAPRPELVREMITEGIQAEKDGLQGRIVIDSRGIELKPGDGYAVYDESLRRLNKLLAEKTKMRVLFDDRPDVIKQHTAPDVALYCGWYKLRSYVPSCGFNPGAVGFHVASLEMVSLHAPNESGWVAGLLRNNVAATLGAVAEPYLSAFPNADDFFPLLLTGELPLAEVYWRTNPMTSWMINMIGDPLYTPYKVNPQMKWDDLTELLRNAMEPMPRVAIPGTRPATNPTTTPTTRP
ncbi:MAG: TIGR03790 family protein, partial [Planctomycetota bacterium]|nr:TIGR03790 family protein [Planctomycetota bacterium]